MCPDRTTHNESDYSTFEVERLEWSPVFTVLETWTIIVLAQFLLIKEKSPCLLFWALDINARADCPSALLIVW